MKSLHLSFLSNLIWIALGIFGNGAAPFPAVDAFGPIDRSTASPFGFMRRKQRTIGGENTLCFVNTGTATTATSTSTAKRRKSSRLQATINFKGESTTSIKVRQPSSSSSSTVKNSLSHWMLSEESDQFFLGTQDFSQRSDGSWDAFQPSVDWFGLELVPVFVIKLERSKPKQQVSAIITEARSDIKSGRDSATGKLVGRVMERSTFQGGNRVSWRKPSSASSTDDGWILEADLSLTLSIPLPPFLPLPPGFNSIGSRIVKSTCRRRLDQFVNNLQASYHDWAKEQEQEQS